jgi:hypothetical protein
MSDEHEYDDIREDLQTMRAEPRPEFTRELDRRAASWLRERPRRRLPSLRIAIPAAAAAATAAIVVALVVSGGDGGGGEDQLEVAVVAEGQTGGGTTGVPGGGTDEAAPGALAAPFEQREQPDTQTDTSGGAFLLPEVEGDTVTVRYIIPAPTTAAVELAGHEAQVEVSRGSGSLEISTKGLPAGTHDLTISTPSAPTFRTPVKIDG